HSRAYRIAFRDKAFLDTDDARAIRLQAELLKAEQVFTKLKIESTIVVFGGTRVDEPAVAAKRVAKIKRKLLAKPQGRHLNKQLRIAKAVLAKSHYYDEARRFGHLVGTECRESNGEQYVIVTGGGPGIMEAANRGAFNAQAKTIGLNITLPMEQEPNPYITPELCLQFHYFAIRKMHFMLRAKALVAFPGGYGTLDELFEALTLVQTAKVAPLPIILFGEEYWRKVIDFDFLVSEGMIDEEDLELFVFCDTAEAAWKYIKLFWEELAE
ncbi:MAG: TIGR00730 family Rossman fold protein, partial [candidate division Zixibacteria bacterium]